MSEVFSRLYPTRSARTLKLGESANDRNVSQILSLSTCNIQHLSKLSTLIVSIAIVPQEALDIFS